MGTIMVVLSIAIGLVFVVIKAIFSGVSKSVHYVADKTGEASAWAAAKALEGGGAVGNTGVVRVIRNSAANSEENARILVEFMKQHRNK